LSAGATSTCFAAARLRARVARWRPRPVKASR
jgi:hypothetical protein